MLTRRTFITAGIAGAAALALAQWWRASPLGDAALRDARTGDILAAIVPAMLGDAVPGAGAPRAAAIASAVDGVRKAIAGLPPASQREIGQLFALLAAAPSRIALTGVVPAWRDAPAADVAAFLERWRTSRFELFRSAYGALHQLIYAAWYAQPSAWPAIGYPGPPPIA